jgi:Calcineurin-like phosphoesterase
MHLMFAVIAALTQQWLLVSDLHLDPFAQGPQTYGRDTTPALLDSAVAQMRTVAPNAQVIIIDGDFLAHHFDAKVRAAGSRQSVGAAALQTMARIERTFARAFPRAQFLIALGNNDDPCGDYRAAPRTAYLSRLARMWAPLVNRNHAAPTFIRDFSQAAFYTARLPVAGLHAIVIDDVYWSLFYRQCKPGTNGMPASEMRWLARTLGAMRGRERTIVVAHIPPGIDPTSTLITHRFLLVPFLGVDAERRLTTILRANAPTISFGVTGHMHRSDFRIFGNVPLLLAPSISPVYNNNPAFLVLNVASDGTLKDYQMYAYRITTGSWSRIFNFDAGLHVDDFSAHSLLLAHDHIANDVRVRGDWESAVVGASPQFAVREVWRSFWCAQLDSGARYAECVGARERVRLFPLAVALAIALVVLGIAVMVRLARQRRRA